MWSAPLLLWIWGSVLLWVPAQRVVIAQLEDDTATLHAEDSTNLRIDDMVTTSTAEKSLVSQGLTPLVPTRGESTTKVPLEDRTISVASDHEGGQSTKSSHLSTAHSMGTVTTQTQAASDKDSWEPLMLAGVVVGILFVIAIIAVIIVVCVRKASGKFSP